MSYAESQKKFCRFVAGHYVVMTRAWKKGERGFNVLWDITRARYIGRKLLVINVHQHALEVQPVNGREQFFVPWFVLEDFQNFQPIPMPPVATNDEPKKDVIESIAEGMALKDANYKGREAMLSNAIVATKNLQSGEVVAAMDIAVAGGDVMKSKPLFAGFWRDGAVVKPQQQNYSDNGYLIVRSKQTGYLHLWDPTGPQLGISEWHWLDTTTPTELTPQQAFEISKIIYPDLHEIEKAERGGLFVNEESTGIVNWDSLTEYPPRERWRVPTDVDKGSKCRAWDAEKRSWTEATFISTWEDAFIVKGGYWPFPIEVPKCEVLVDESN